MNAIIPLKKRPIDIPIIIFFIVNLFFVTYIVDFEQIAIPDYFKFIADPKNPPYPLWPLPFLVDMVHWWGRTFDPVLLARPVWWKATIWIDSLIFGPFYAAALYAFIKGKEWIRNLCFIWSGIMFANVTIILSEEIFGPHATPTLVPVLAANAPWLLFPAFVSWRMWKEHPFTESRD